MKIPSLYSERMNFDEQTPNLKLPSKTFSAVCLHEIFEAQVDQAPRAIALISEARALTYAELDQESNRLARFLRDQGAGPGKFVAIYFERSSAPIVTILACLKAGAAYIPLDPTYPLDRIRHILAETRPVVLVTESGLASKARDLSQEIYLKVLDLQAEAHSIEALSSERLSRQLTGLTPEDLCYVIYTSGTTGRPKGVMAEHRNVSVFVDAFNQVCGTGVQDRVYQGFSLGFDGSVEEIWMAFSNGSALVVGGKDTPRFGAELGRFLETFGVTYFSTVPTLLSTLPELPRCLKTLVVSGEACPLELINRTVRPGLRMLNVYGPTEATVNTTYYECVAHSPVKIGRPLPGYEIHVLDSQMNPVKNEEKGELFISGQTLSRGYLNQPELTAKSFVLSPDGKSRLYRTGDLVSLSGDGELDFFGRIDSQVKIRGYRVELAEIESILLESPHIQSACVKLVEKDGLQELAAYVVLDNGFLDRGAVLSTLESRLPPYMIPGFLEVVPEFVMLSSGKVDRKSLPVPKSPLLKSRATRVAPATELESRISQAWSEILGFENVSVEEDFFLDLGGHSLLAARLATRLRTLLDKNVTVRDIYGFPTIRKLAEIIEQMQGSQQAVITEQNRVKAGLGIAIAQVVSLYLIYGLIALPPVLLFMWSLKWILGIIALKTWICNVLMLSFLTFPVFMALGVALKWLIIGRFRAGSYPLWGSYYFRFWLVSRFQALTGAGLLVGTPLMPYYYRLMGAQVGKNCTLDTGMVAAWDLISIGDETSIGADSQLLGSRVENGMLHLGRVDIGNRCFVGLHSALGLNTRMEDESKLDDQSLLPDFEAIPQGEGRRGSPAQAATIALPLPSNAKSRPMLFGLLHLVAAEVLGLFFLIPAAPFLAYWYYAFENHGNTFGVISLLASVPLGFLSYLLFFAGVKKLVCSKAKPGVYPVKSLFYLRKWLSDGMMRASRVALLPIYTTIYLPTWLRLMGAKIGARAELSTVWNFCPELIDVGAESFFADGSIIGGKRFYRGSFQIGINRIGRRSFVGNSAVLPVGVGLGDGCLLGVQSIPPAGASCTKDGTEWLGSPAFALPRRPKVGGFDDSVTFQPSLKLYLQRCAIDALRILIPGYIALFNGVMASLLSYYIYRQIGFTALIWISPVIAFAFSILSALITIAIKWLVMGRFKPVIVPLWSKYVWLNEMVNGIYESVMAPAISPLKGTPMIAPFLRWIGCKIGKHNYIESILFSEFDLVEIGSFAALNTGSIVQSHLFEDRIMKSSYLKIGDGCSVGNMAVVLYDSEMKSDAVLGPLSLLMKGETLEKATRSHGIPTQQITGLNRIQTREPIGLRTEISFSNQSAFQAQETL